MDERFSVYYAGEHAGTADFISQGLYWKIDCRCKLPAEGFFQLVLQMQEKEINLGTLLYDGNTYILEKKIPKKTIVKEGFFLAIREKYGKSEMYIPLKRDQPFPFIYRLINGRFTSKEGENGILLKGESTPRGNDPTQEPRDK